jgi:transporter family protein
MDPVLLIVLTAVCYGLYNFCIKVASGSIHEIAGALLLQVVSALLGGAALLYLRWQGTPMAVSGRGVLYAVAAGVFVGLAEILSFAVFARGVPASVGIPAIIGGGIVVGAALGLLALHETLAPLQALAILLILAGIVLLHVR